MTEVVEMNKDPNAPDYPPPYQQPPPQQQYNQPPPDQYQQQQQQQQTTVVSGGYGGGGAVVTGGGGGTTVIVQQAAIRPSNYMALSVITCLCCNVFFGIAAIILSVMSSSAADEGDLDGAKSKGKAAMWVSVAGILVTVVIAIAIIVWYVVAVATVVNAVYGK